MKPCPICGGKATAVKEGPNRGAVSCSEDDCFLVTSIDLWDLLPRPSVPLHVAAKLIDDLVLEIHKRPHGWGDRFDTLSEAERAIRNKLMAAMGHEVDQ